MVGFPLGLVEESFTTWWFVHTTPADRNVSLVEKGRAVNLLLAGDDGCLFHRDGGPVTTILSREGRSPRMTFRM